MQTSVANDTAEPAKKKSTTKLENVREGATIEASNHTEINKEGESANVRTTDTRGNRNLQQTHQGEQERQGSDGAHQRSKNSNEHELGPSGISDSLLAISNQVNEVRAKKGLDSFEVEITDASTFHKSQLEAQKTNPHKGYVDVKTEEDLVGCTIIKVKGANAGVAIKPDGDIVALHKDSNSTIKDIGPSLVIMAREMGGLKMDNYGSDLTNFYERAGFKPVNKLTLMTYTPMTHYY